jgi:diguanylate cyclase (GGDEF)-like protein
VSEKIGPAAGDQLLTIVASRLEGVVRAQDSVGSLGGDEFVVLVESAARGARLESLARRVIEALHKPVELDDFGPSFCVTASIGVAFGRYESADDLLRDARLAMYAAKSAGKDRYTLFNANMRSVTESRAVLEAELNRALQEHQFSLLYQPIYDLSTRKVTGVEALVRWQHPTKGLLAPAEFIPLAEETGLIVPIGRWVLEEACSSAAAWHVAGHRVGISVNVSSNQLHRDGFLTDVRRALQQTGIEPSLLTLEIDESTVIRDIGKATERLQELKQLGVRTAIDEFGSGYAYHSDLRRMPLDFLKVDRSSLAATEDEDYRSWLLETILVVARDLSLTVIAKGIDTNEQLMSLQAMGCSMAQGFFLAKPGPVEEVARLFGVEFSPPAPEPPSEGAAPSPSIAEPGTATTGTQVQVLRSTYEPPAGQS